ncbi:hypothetical protein ACFLQ4_02200 [Bacteroidota bacterium]
MNEPINVSPLIGDRLDPIEKRFFNLPPPLKGFNEAVFSLESDSSLTAKITYQMNEIIKDTIIHNYLSLSSLQNYLVQQTIDKIGKNEQSYMEFFCYDSIKISASLYRLNESSISVIKPNIKYAINSGNLNDYMLDEETNEVQKIIIQEDATVWPYAVGGSLLGLIAGGIIGGSMVDNQSDDIVEAVFAKPVEKGAAIALGALIGAAFGLAVGIVIGNNISTDIEFVAHLMSGYSILERRALLYSVSGDR